MSEEKENETEHRCTILGRRTRREEVLHSDTVKFTPKNWSETVEYGGFISHWNHNHCQKCFFSCSQCPREQLRDRQSKGNLLYVDTLDSVEAAALRSHISLPSHTLTLQSHCSSINLPHPAIWSPSSHSDTQTSLTGTELTHTSPMYKGPRMISLRFISFCKHICVSVHTHGISALQRTMDTCMHMHWQWTGGEGSCSKRWDDLGVENSATPSITFPRFKEEFDSVSSVRHWVWVTHSFVCSRQAIRLSRFQSLPLAGYISLWQFAVQCFIFSKKQTGAGPGGTPKQNTSRNARLLLKIKPLNCHINKTTFQGRSFCESRAVLTYEHQKVPTV